MKYLDFKRSILRNKSVRLEYEKLLLQDKIGKHIATQRKTKHITQAQLAAAIGSKQSAIARLETGNHLPTLEYLLKIAEALDMELQPPKLRSK